MNVEEETEAVEDPQNSDTHPDDGVQEPSNSPDSKKTKFK
jgi:hypothetical protein